MEHMIRVGAIFVIPTDRFDISTYSRTALQAISHIYCYENCSGGIGVAKKLFSVWQVALERGVEVARNCECRLGCQNCIEPTKYWDISKLHIDKIKCIELAEELLEIVSKGPDKKFQDGLMVSV